ncbi:MAG TPA: sulfite exporter TauE/SafE family protein [Bryobacteraceae bacterium]|nr:sulfite exporter TauE/SafE family protein [Bryobacteraceae bacterium]
MPHLEAWKWALGIVSAFMIGMSKTGAPAAASMVIPFMVMIVGDARLSAAWTQPILSSGDLLGLYYWRKHADAKKLFSLIPWVLVGIVAASFALELNERIIRMMVAVIVLLMLIVQVWRRWGRKSEVHGSPVFYGISAGFATTIANAAAPVMNMYLLSSRLPKERFVATGTWFFFVANLLKVPVYIWYGLYSRESLLFDAAMFPAVMLGGVAGKWFVSRVPQRIFDLLVIVITALSALLLFR